MYGGQGRARALSWAAGLRQGPTRAAFVVGTIAVLVGALVSGARQPSVDMLATAAVPPAGLAPDASAPAPPPVHLPHPSGRAVRAPASSSKVSPLPSHPDAQGIPAVALEAYQRAAVVIDSADTSCQLGWTLLAGIGQVESDHGQVGGSRLDRDGVARPSIIGPRLDGRHGTSLVRDTDAGRLDGDRRFDRAVGPMQFLPSTWAAVAVDGDADGRRDVQDIDDAALGSAVYLCADHGDLSTRAGQEAALLRYNHSRAYVVRVLAIARDYRRSSTQLPSSRINARSVSLDQSARHGRHHGHHRRHHPGGPGTDSPGPGSPQPTPPPTGGPSPTPPGTPGGGNPTPPGNPGYPGNPDEPPVIPDPLPAELADLTPAQVEAYDDAWATCDDDLTPGWSTQTYVVATLTQCLADQLGVPADDPELAVFLQWLAGTQDPAVAYPSPSPSQDPSPSPDPASPDPASPDPTTPTGQ